MKKFLVVSTTIVIFSIIASAFANKIYAYITERDYNRTYEVADDYLKVTETKTLRITQPSWYIPQGSEEVFTIFNPIQGDPNLESKKKLTTDSIKAVDSEGNTLQYSLSDTEKGNSLISIKTARLIKHNDSYSITLTYNSYGLLSKSGAIRDTYIPAFSSSYVFESDSTKESVSTKLISNKQFGEINFSVPQTQVATEGDNYILNFSQESLVGDTGWVQIGKSQYFTFNLRQDYSKTTDFPFSFNTYKIVIPRNIKSGFITQNIYFTNITPQPDKIEQDGDGNLIAFFKIPAVDSGTIQVEGYAILNEDSEFNLLDSGNVSDIPKSILEISTKNGKYWEVDTVEIQNLARELKGSETDVYKLVEKTYKYVIDKIDYSEVKRFGINERQGALKTLQGGAAVCMEYSDLFITLLRAIGIPARGAFGYGYSPLDYESINDGSINHQWAEVYLPKYDIWVPADTTWGESGNLLIGGDLNHFYSHVASVNPETPSTTEVTFYGQSPTLPDRDMNVEIVEELAVKDLNGLTQDGILAKYKADSSASAAIQNILDSINLFFDRSPQEFKIVAIVVLVGIVLIILFAILLRIRRKVRS